MRRPRAPTCPACGYDQSGVIGAWTDACPLEGTCSECGITFEWEDLLSRRPRDRMELFDFATRLRGYSFVYTLLVVALPWRLWRVAGTTPRYSMRRTAMVAGPAFLFWNVAAVTTTQLAAIIGYPVVHIFWYGDDYPEEWIFPAAWAYGVWDEGERLSTLSWGIPAGLVFLAVATPAMPLLTWIASGLVFRMRDTARVSLLTAAGIPLALLPGFMLGLLHEAAWDIHWSIESNALEEVLYTYEFVRGALDTLMLCAWVSLCWLCALRIGYSVRRIDAHALLLVLTALVLLFAGALAFFVEDFML